MQKRIKPKSLVREMLSRYGEPSLRKLWQDNGGGTIASRIISMDMGRWVTEAQFDYLAKLYNWRRKIRPDHPIAIGVAIGNLDPNYFKQLQRDAMKSLHLLPEVEKTDEGFEVM